MPVPIVYPITFVVLAILGLFAPKDGLLTIGSELVQSTAAPWKNPFKLKSILEYADTFIALQADRVIPTLIPGATSAGRPYIMSLSHVRANVTATALKAANMTEGNIWTDSGMWTDSYPTATQPIHLDPILPTGDLLSFWTLLLLSSVLTLLAFSTLYLFLENRTLQVTITENPLVNAILGKFNGMTATDHARNTELLREMKLGLPCNSPSNGLRLEGLCTHIDFVLNIITERDNYYAEKEAALGRVFEIQSALEKIEAFHVSTKAELRGTTDRLNATLAKIEDLQQALQTKNFEHDTIQGKLRESTKQLQISNIERDNAKQSLDKRTADSAAIAETLRMSNIHLEQARGQCENFEKAIAKITADSDALRRKLKEASSQLAELSLIRKATEDISHCPLPPATDDELLDPRELYENVQKLKEELITLRASSIRAGTPIKDSVPSQDNALTDGSSNSSTGPLGKSSVSPFEASSQLGTAASPGSAFNPIAPAFAPAPPTSIDPSQRSLFPHAPLAVPVPPSPGAAAAPWTTTGSDFSSASRAKHPDSWRTPEEKELIRRQLIALQNKRFWNGVAPATAANQLGPSTSAQQNIPPSASPNEGSDKDLGEAWLDDHFDSYKNSNDNAAGPSPSSLPPIPQEHKPASGIIEVKPDGDTGKDGETEKPTTQPIEPDATPSETPQDEGNKPAPPPIPNGAAVEQETTPKAEIPSQRTPPTPSPGNNHPLDNKETAVPTSPRPKAAFVQPPPPSSRHGSHQDHSGQQTLSTPSPDTEETAVPTPTAPKSFVQPQPSSSRRGGGQQDRYGPSRGGRGNNFGYRGGRGRGAFSSTAGPSSRSNDGPLPRNGPDPNDPEYYFKDGKRFKKLSPLLQAYKEEKEERERRAREEKEREGV
ncbi:MAG: hypothetical protein Q9222_002569 [Ikaeria aurantiellina]